MERLKKGLARFQSDRPELSLVVIAYNEERYLLAHLASLAQQELEVPTELLVVNNASTDSTQDILDTLGVRSFYEPEKGWASARQRGLMEAKGKVVVTADSDNLYPPLWLQSLSKPLLGDSPPCACVCSAYYFYAENQRYPPALGLYQIASLNLARFRHWQRPHLNCRGGSMAFRKCLAMEVGGYPEHLGRGEDGRLAFALAKMGPVCFLTDRRSACFSNLRTLLRDGKLWQAFLRRFGLHGKRFFAYFTEQKQTK